MKYYHIQKLGGINTEWSVGDIIKTGNNDFFKSVLNGIERISKPLSNEKRLFEKSNQILSNNWINELDNNSENYKDLYYKMQGYCFEFENIANDLYKSHLQYLKWIREEIFENNRKLIYPNLPSRKKCVWFCEKKNLEYWWNELSSTQNKKKIIEVELIENGKIHFANGKLMSLETYGIEEFNNNSKEYWNGITKSKLSIEILFEGSFKVINEYKNINEIKKTCT